MNTTKNTLVLLLAGLAANSASAFDEIKLGQAGLTLYGRASAGLDYTTNVYSAGNQGDRWQTASNQWGVSYWGMKARFPVDEDVTAVLNLESGFGTDTGALTEDGKLFDREANVGLRHARFGAVSMGTHLWIAQDILDVDPMRFQSYGINTLVNGANDGAASRSVLLRSPDWNGFSIAYMHAFGAAAGEFKRSSSDGVSVAFRSADLTVRAIYGQRADQFGRHSGGASYGLGSRDEWTYVKNLTVGGAYKFGGTTLFAGFEQVKAPETGYGIRATFDEKARMAWVGVNHKITQKTTLLGAAYHLKQSFSGKQSTLGTLGIAYDWNQYLGLYATAGYIGNNTISPSMVQNTGGNSHALSYRDAACNAALECNGTNQIGTYAGIVVKF
ncbi:porin [Oxalobacteraceae bacterium OTU3CAMAD1]|nr:porin [Oxalobacteraceae bacterium OTU3CAMAD1]